MTISSPRAEIVARARVTDRMRPLKIDRATIHQVGLPWHWGRGGPVPGDAANDLILLSRRPEHVDPRVQGVRVQRARRPRQQRHDASSPASATRRPASRPTRTIPAEVTEHE